MALTRGRVLPAADAPRVAPPPGQPLGGLRHAELVRAHQQAQATLASARAEADKILSEGRLAVAHVRDAAERDGRAAAEAALASRWIDLRRAQDAWLDEREEHLLAVARLLAERLLGRSLQLAPDTILDLARQALAPLRRARRIVISAHPDDAPALHDGLASLGLDPVSLEVQIDPSAARGNLRISTELGHIRADLAPQLDRLLASLRER